MKKAHAFAARPIRVAIRFAVGAFLLSFAFATDSPADEPEGKSSPNIEGVWQLHGRIGDDGEVNELVGQEADALILKIISEGRWCVTYADSTTGGIRMHHGGTYMLKGNQYTEHVEYASESTRTMVNGAFTFEVQVEGETLTQKGIGNPYDEVWKRAKTKL